MDFSKSNTKDVSFQGALISGSKFRKGDQSVADIQEAGQAYDVTEIDEEGHETPHPGSPKRVRDYGKPLPYEVLNGQKGYHDRVISQLSHEPPAVYVRLTTGGWWAKVSPTEHRPVTIFRHNWYETSESQGTCDPNERVKVIHL